MKKHILWIPQLATIDKKDGKVIINADSNICIMNGLIESLKDDYRFTVLMPLVEHCNVSSRIVSKYASILRLSKKPSSSFALRYSFDFDEMIEVIKFEQPDVIVNNTSTLTRNIKAVLYETKSKAKIVNYMHFLDVPGEDKVPKEISYFIRQMEGLICADLAVCQSHMVRYKSRVAIDHYLEEYAKQVNPGLQIKVWNATYSHKEVNTFEEDKEDEIKRIIFPNRLSSTNYSNHLRFFEAIRNIATKRNDFEVFVSNPTKFLSTKELKALCPNLIPCDELLDRETYLKMLKTCHIGVALFTQEGHGGVSSKEFQAAGCLPIYPKVNEYKYLMSEHYPGFCDVSLKDLEKSINTILNICDDVKKVEVWQKEAVKLIYERDSFEFNANKVKKDLKILMGE